MDEDKKKRLVKKLRNKYRLVILNDDTFEEKLSLKLSPLNLFVLTGFSAILLVSLTAVFIAFTPLREYIPGYSSTALKRKAFRLAQTTDSLSLAMQYNRQYLLNIRYLIEGRSPLDLSDTSLTDSAVEVELRKGISKNDSMLRRFVEEEERFNVASAPKSELSSKLNFFTPIKGLVTNKYNLEQEHLGLDIVAEQNEVIKSVQDGVVIFSEFTAETGFVIIIQHANRFISVYKHNSALLKAQGELVTAGEPISIIGNSGELSSGPHLHFELWFDGHPVNPQDYISF